MKPHVLISGGTGLIGSHLSQLLIHRGYSVTFLTRQCRSLTGISVIRWDPEKQWIDDFEIEGPLAIINLSGENLAAKIWTIDQKEKILNSRVDSLKLIKSLVEQRKMQVVRVISTSAIGYYGTFTSEQIFAEDSQPGTDFLAETCVEWEKAIKKVADLGVSTAWVRTGVVLSDKGGALKAIQDSMRTGLAIPLGNGNQWVPWIHIRDLVRIFEFLLEESDLQGVFNGTAPAEDTNRTFTKAISKVSKKIYVPFGLPAFILKMILGEMAGISLFGSRISPDKIQKAGFHFQHNDLESAIMSFRQQRRGGIPFESSPDS